MRTSTLSPTDYLSDAARDFLARRTAEVVGLALLVGTVVIGLSLASWSIRDPSWNHATDAAVHNLMGAPGAVAADLIMQLVGVAVIAILTPIACWGWRLLVRKRLDRLKLRFGLLTAGAAAAAALASLLPATDRWPLPTGLGGVAGDALLAVPRRLFGHSEPVFIILALILAGIAILTLTASAGFGLKDKQVEEDEPASTFDWVSAPRQSRSAEEDRDGEPGFALVSLGAAIHAGLTLKSAVLRFLRRRRHADDRGPEPYAPWVGREPDDSPFADLHQDAAVPPAARSRVEPTFGAPARAAIPQAPRAARGKPDTAPSPMPGMGNGLAGPRVIQPAMASSSRSTDGFSGRPTSRRGDVYELPPLGILAEAKAQPANRISEDALEQNARLLEGVLEDFGIRGEIINVRPGPVVTLYELEPAPGIKSSRVVGLADDIARSMSAISARVAVVQGRNVIGIELPNQRRDTVYLRELLGQHDFEESKHKLAIALGKTIGGEPVIVDLARMPHLLVAGTTGSGKSVAINTMILSLLYRLKPEECRLIMVDPKMLELSVYDGIPHLLTPVVTDPKKAVVALKWAVREMEDRYKKMSKVGVRNIDGFNVRVADAKAKGEVITRTVQTGYDRETGEAIYEQEAMDLTVLPYIVVIVDEMADLMMVAGKDIEGAIQRLAQMARAAGIHLIMATQRPSVDVITGTIKANFPTRISFQVTSKIDSRTILGEQGAEQLLGQGDMLYMAGGGRISRVHGPFVSDGEVEKVVAHLKTQGQPDYLDVTVEEPDLSTEDDAAGGALPGGMDAEESGDLYDRAVAIVLRDKKCSTSYIQRRLSVGYNKAASLVERMEQEGVVAPANHAGKREILVGGGIDRGAYDLQDDQ
ncbi:DNA translocase FtsK [Lichenihabitans psoromatis]|uniref:DNA translocase FtsK n=1 Tax=Lichenihabitans psoromatis TaxID=2528642 RepID=UPI0010383A8F|nr:DNA translocase FtsK [Lichenihabitans psoromatis]